MKKSIILLLLLPFFLQAQDNNIPSVKFDQGSILYYIPAQSAFAPLLPVIKPGFVHIIQTPGFQSLSNKAISDNLTSGIRNLLSKPMSLNQKTKFLENYTSLVLMNYSSVSDLESAFYHKAVALQNDADRQIKEKAELVVEMLEMYLGNGVDSNDQNVQ